MSRKGRAYYNEFDPFAASWLRNLIKAGLIPDGDVDERDLRDIRPSEIEGYTQYHFFAGIGGWAYALRLAGWPDDRPVWTGSPPCQPFSSAGRREGFADERHLWPAFLHHIRVLRPQVLFMEQVASQDGLAWLDLVSSDLEGEGYAVGSFDLCAAGVGSPHIRQRLWVVAERVADPQGVGCIGGVQGASEKARKRRENASPATGSGRAGGNHLVDGFWQDADWLLCKDGIWRPVEPGSFPLADGVPARVGRLRAYGNAIVPQVAAEVIRAWMGVQGGLHG